MNQKAQALISAIQEELGPALEDAVVGQNLHPRLKAQLKRTATSVLYRHAIRKSLIDVQQQGTTFSVTITLPPQGPIVQTIRLRFGNDTPMF